MLQVHIIQLLSDAFFHLWRAFFARRSFRLSLLLGVSRESAKDTRFALNFLQPFIVYTPDTKQSFSYVKTDAFIPMLKFETVS